MAERATDTDRTAGFCPHGNYAEGCEACLKRKGELFDLLRTPEEEHREAIQRPGNTVLRFGSEGREVIAHGTMHVFSKEPIAEVVSSFENEQPDLLIVEGTAKPEIDPNMSGDEVLARHGEQQYFRWLAKQRGIEVRSWDVPWVNRFRDALAKHGRDEVVGWTIAYAAKLLFEKKGGEPPSTEEVRSALKLALDKNTVESLQKEFPELELEPDTLDLDAILKKFSGGKAISELSAEAAEDLGTPWHGGETNDVIRDMIVLRDRNAIETIDDARRTHKKVFVIAGNDHVLTWEKALQKMAEEKS